MMKNLAICGIALVFAIGCSYTSGDRTVFHQEDGSVDIVRAMEFVLDENLEAQLSACIAVPSTWQDSVIVQFAGTYMIEEQVTNFTASGTRNEEVESDLGSLIELGDLIWLCFQDIARDFALNNSGDVTFSFIPDSAEGMVYTAMSHGDEFGLASHQVIQDETINDHWVSYASDSLSTGHDVTHFVDLNNATYLLTYAPLSDTLSSVLYKVLDDGLSTISGVPNSTDLLYINNQFISLRSFHNTNNSNADKNTTALSFSADLINWSMPIEFPYIETVQWDAANNEFVALAQNVASSSHSELYTSENLIDWVKSDLTDMEYPTVAYLPDGLALLNSDIPLAPYQLRDSANGSWSDISTIPPSIDTTEGAQFQVTSLVTYNSQFHTTGIGKVKQVDDSLIDTLFYGVSSDGVSWTWVAMNESEGLATDVSLTFLSGEDMFYLSEETLMRSIDNGSSWQALVNPLSLFIDDTELSDYTTTINSITKKADSYYIQLNLIGNDELALVLVAFLLETTDFINFKLVTIANEFQITQTLKGPVIAESTYLGALGQRVIRLVDATVIEPDPVEVESGSKNDESADETSKNSKSNTKSGALNLALFLLLPVLLLKRRKSF